MDRKTDWAHPSINSFSFIARRSHRFRIQRRVRVTAGLVATDFVMPLSMILWLPISSLPIFDGWELYSVSRLNY